MTCIPEVCPVAVLGLTLIGWNWGQSLRPGPSPVSSSPQSWRWGLGSQSSSAFPAVEGLETLPPSLPDLFLCEVPAGQTTDLPGGPGGDHHRGGGLQGGLGAEGDQEAGPVGQARGHPGDIMSSSPSRVFTF